MSPAEEYREWADGWRQAAEDDAHRIRQDQQDWSPEHRRGYGDYWAHKSDYPGRYEDWNIILDVPAETRQQIRLGFDAIGEDFPF